MIGPTYRELIVRGAEQHGDRVAVCVGETTLSFAEVDDLSTRYANALLGAGIAPRARVALLINNSLLSVPVDFACVKANLNRVPLNARLSLDEHARMLVETRAEVLLHGPDLRERALELADRIPGLRRIPLVAAENEEVASLARLGRTASPRLPALDVRPDDVIITLFTSGTTGTLKAAQHTQASYAAICRNVLLNLIAVRPDDVMLHAASLLHASGVFVLPFWLRGARTVILPGFEPAGYLDALEREGATTINLVPTMLQLLLAEPSISGRDFSRLRALIYGASPIPRPVLERALDVFGRTVFYQYYGQTEAPLCLTVLRPEDHVPARLGSCGRPAIDVELALVDEAGAPVRRGEAGEIAVRCPSMMAGYFEAPELDAQMRLPDGWLRTRDVGRFDGDGFLYLLDRTSDMIVTGGYNVYPREVEDVLLAHPAVRECAVIGLPDETWVEAVTAVVTLHADGAAGADELIAFCRERLASYKKPQRVLFDPAIPKTAVGKLSRKALRERYGPVRA
ncbi:MAG TPA: AMP-binding protein [Candidatus Sulfotelmatobacter sp.]|nr:AMP-binding protein [Candidatus Sulfotelmatobacter sp.]